MSDDTVANIETDKVTIPINSPDNGLLIETYASAGETVDVGGKLFKLDTSVKPPQKTDENQKKEKSENHIEKPPVEKKSATALKTKKEQTTQRYEINQSSEKMSRMRLRIAERMMESQKNTASLTTFNEIDMTSLISLRHKYKDLIQKKHDVKLGFMSPFIKACSQILQEIPIINAQLDINNQEIIYNENVDISVAVATPKGLVTPVLKGCHKLGFIDIERMIYQLGNKAKENNITIEELTGGTFTISNGGVFGSMMGTPILNSPQSAILGMHAIKERATVVNGKIEIRPIMMVALTYDHRIIDGREAVTFLVRLKELLEDPLRFLIEL